MQDKELKESKQLNLFEELEKQIEAEAKEQSAVSKSQSKRLEAQRGRPVGSKVNKTYKAEELINELESKGGTPDKSFQVEVESSNPYAEKTCCQYAETEIEETFRIIKDLARLLKKFAEN